MAGCHWKVNTNQAEDYSIVSKYRESTWLEVAYQETVILTQGDVVFFQIERLRIGHDSKGDGKGIFVEEVEVAPGDGDRAIFPCYCWLTEGRGDKKIERDILPGQPRPPRPSECNFNSTTQQNTPIHQNPKTAACKNRKTEPKIGSRIN